MSVETARSRTRPDHFSSRPGGPRPPVGNTPVQWISGLRDPARGFWAKLEGHNPGGMKDRPALHMVEAARRRGELRPGGRIVESTSGTLGLGLALAGVVHGHPVTLVTDPGADTVLRRLLTARGADLDLVEEPGATGGWQEARRQRVADLLARHADAWCPDQYHNPDNAEGYRPLAQELAEQLGRIDVLVCSVGTGGHSAGIARALRECCPQLRLVGVDAVGSTLFGQPARPRIMRGLGSSIHPRNVDHAAFDEVHWVNAAEAVWTCRELAASHCASGGWSVGAAALVADWVARTEGPDARVAAVFPDGPHRYTDSIYDPHYCAENELLSRPPAAEPDVIGHPLAREVHRWTRCADVRDPLRTAESGGVPWRSC